MRIVWGGDNVTLNTLENSGRTPRLWVAVCGGPEVINIFVKWANIPRNTCNNCGRVPLKLAAELLAPVVTQILWGQENITLNTLHTLIRETNLATGLRY